MLLLDDRESASHKYLMILDFAWKIPRPPKEDFITPIVPQSEIPVKFLQELFKETDEKRGEILAKFSVDFRPSISRETGHKKFHTNSSTHQDLKFHTAEPKSFHSDTLGVGGPKILKQAKGSKHPDKTGAVRTGKVRDKP